jgi:AhpD family alkylhydroperoxidase
MKHPVMILPDAMSAMQALHASTKASGLPERTALLAILRASQINGCSFCVDMHARELRQAGETDERLFGVAAWHDSTYFTDAERAALALTEALTRLADRPDPVSDELWREVTRHYDEKAISGLLIAIGSINVWNRLNAAIRQPPMPVHQHAAATA